MTRRLCVSLTALLCLLALAGCRTASFDGEELSKTQRIVIADAGGAERGVLTEEADIERLVEAVNVTGWHIAEKPEGLTPSGTLTLWQEETAAALLAGREPEQRELCTLQCYEDGDYLTIVTGVVDLTFSIPQETAAYLRSLWA
ncbi:MAG: hypothetical protein HFF82_07140 [Oscillospiraceae bacterium]|jgi:hypothetical protein|nr:hypothetical protein [Oscillospiraceae bacterium]